MAQAFPSHPCAIPRLAVATNQFSCEVQKLYVTGFDSSSWHSCTLQHRKCKCQHRNGLRCQALLCCRNGKGFSSLQVCVGANRDSRQSRRAWSVSIALNIGGYTKECFSKGQRNCSYASQRCKSQEARPAKFEDGQVLDWQWTPTNLSSVIGTDSEAEFDHSESMAVVGNLDDEAHLDYRVSNLAQAVAREDSQLAEQILDEMGNSSLMKEMQQIVEDIGELEEQLQELYEEVSKMIEEGDDDTARALVEANYDALAEQLESGADGIEQAAMLDVLAQLRMELRDFKEAEQLLEKAKGLMEKVSTPEPLVDSILEHMGSMYTALGKPKEALIFFNKSLEIQESLLGSDSPLLAKTLLGLAIAHHDLDNATKSIEIYQRVLAMLEESKGPYDESLAIPLTHLGHVLLEIDRMDEAEVFMRRALKILQKAHGLQDGRVGLATCALARVKSEQGDNDDAVRLYRKGLRIVKGCSNFDQDDPAFETARADLAELLSTIGRYEEAQELLEDILHAKEQALGPSDPQLVIHLHNLANSYAQSGNFTRSELLVRRSLKLVTASLGPTASQVSVPLELLATVLQHQRKHIEAEPLARQALVLRETAFGKDHPVVGDACNCLAAILHSLGRDAEALTLMYRVLKIQERELDHESPEIGLTLQLIAMLLDNLGRYAELQPLIERLERINAKAEAFMS
ncbi:hypothetical protein O6H91_18G009800 [Diphasiastrum complanatum]|uniref:Uncharacterized protein n=1 Tax=Diphasiastrum complanatum TaxID=34168 RepID=A0ACC2AY01_DIPCM|nr:hypothetical protein O6H91_18G009800 [Diphasiastrum complanatum]